MIVWQQGEDYVLMYSNFFFVSNQSRKDKIFSFVILSIVSFSAFTPLLSMYTRYKVNVSLYEWIVLVLAPLSWGKYRRRKSVRYFEKIVGFINVTF